MTDTERLLLRAIAVLIDDRLGGYPSLVDHFKRLEAMAREIQAELTKHDQH